MKEGLMDLIEQLHEGALRCAADYLKRESELIDYLQRIEERRGYTRYGFPSLFQYAVGCLKLSESKSYELISIARKSREVPQLKKAISQGPINSSQAKRIVSVITPENQAQWIEMSATLSQRELEKRIVEVNPKEAVKEKMSFVNPIRIELKCGISEDLMKQIERIKDLVSQKSAKPASLEDTLQAMSLLYLDKKDPVEIAGRVLRAKNQLSSRRATPKPGNAPMPAQVRHEVTRRDNGQCTYVARNGKRCEQRKWVDLHHKKPVSDGGEHDAGNIVTLCRGHHRLHHQLTL
jgi:5-methylcytosine-specific restriction endonuclease McrA